MILEGLTVQTFVGEVGYGHFNSDINSEVYHISGFCIIYSNGYKSISGGGGCGGEDVAWFYVLDEYNNLITEF